MTLSRQDDALTTRRANQRARTHRALIDAAYQLMSEGRPPSMPEAAERALVSIATAYRYFRTAEELWADAAVFGNKNIIDPDELAVGIEACGDDVEARVAAMAALLQGALLERQLLARQSVKASLDKWFAQEGTADADRPTRPAERMRWIELALEPLRGSVEDHHVDSIAAALGLVVGAEAVVSALDVLHLSPEAAKDRIVVTSRWILRAALAEIDAPRPPARQGRRKA
jgi:AcrR family transcriptional regulator